MQQHGSVLNAVNYASKMYKRKLSFVRSGSVIMTDKHWSSKKDVTYLKPSCSYSDIFTAISEDATNFLHGNFANVLLIDGSVRSIRYLGGARYWDTDCRPL